MKEERMAVKDLFIKFGIKGAKSSEKQVSNLDKSLKTLGANALKAGGAFFAIDAIGRALGKVINLSGEMKKVKTGFDNLSSGVGMSENALSKLQKATDGTVSKLDLMTQANNMLLLGITDSEDEMSEMFDIAQRLGSALGKDTLFGVESLVTGMGRQSKLMLDNLGIMIDVEKANKEYAKSINKTSQELTDQERKIAFNNATMKSARELVANLGDEQLSTSDAINQLSASVDNLAADIGNMLAPIVTATAQGMTFLAEGVSKVIKRFKNFGEEVGKFIKIVPESDIELNKFKTSIQKFSQKELLEMINQMEKSNEGIKAVTDSTKEEDEKLKALVERYKKLNELMGFEAETKEKLNETIRITKDLRIAEAESIQFVNQMTNEEKLAAQQDFSEQYRELITSDFDMQRILMSEDVKRFTQAGISKTKIDKFQAESRKKIRANELSFQLGSFSQLMGSLESLNNASKGSALISARLAQAKGIADTYAGANKALASAPPPYNYVLAAAVTAAGLANVVNISRQIGDMKGFADGGVVPGTDRGQGDTVPAMLTPGEVILNQAQQQNLASNMGTTVNIQGNVLGTEEFVRDTLIPEIQRGINLA
jgi:hypothetical protein